MRLLGLPLAAPNVYGISAFITAPYFSHPKPMLFLVDTGASYTTIGYSDGLDFEIILKVKDEKPAETTTGSGKAQILPLYNCTLNFLIEGFQDLYQEKMDVIYVLKYTPYLANQDKLMEIPSILGMDFLKNCNISFSHKHVFLER
jgi:hypothetical protein